MKLFAGTTSLVGNWLFSSAFLWSLIRSFGVGIALDLIACLMNSASLVDSRCSIDSSRQYASSDTSVSLALGISFPFFARWASTWFL